MPKITVKEILHYMIASTLTLEKYYPFTICGTLVFQTNDIEKEGLPFKKCQKRLSKMVKTQNAAHKKQ